MPNNNKQNNAWKWIANNIRVIITVVLLIIGFTVTVTTVSLQVSANESNIGENTTSIDDMKEDMGEDIDNLKGDMREVKAILIRIERMLMNNG